MPKLKRPYISFFDFLLDYEQGYLYEQNIGDYYHEEPLYDFNIQMQGSLQPFREMRSDFYATFWPYPTLSAVLFEFLQPFIGIFNIGRMAFNIFLVPIVFVLCTLFYFFEPSTFLKNMRGNLIRSLPWLVEGLACGIQGLAQLITTPLRLGLRIPFRSVLTIHSVSTIHKKIMQPKSKIEDLVNSKAQGKMFASTLVPFLDVISIVRLSSTSHLFKAIDYRKGWEKLTKELSEHPQFDFNESCASYCKSGLILKGMISEAIRNNSPVDTLNQLFAEVLRKGYEKLQPLLIDKINPGRSLTLPNFNRHTMFNSLLHLAAKQGYSELIVTLLDKGSPIDIEGAGFMSTSESGAWVERCGHTPLDVAVMNGHVACVRILIDRGANIDHASLAWGDTPLHHAAEGGHLECVVILLEENARVDVRNRNQYLAFELARQNKHLDCMKCIEDHIEAKQIELPPSPSMQCSIL